MEIPKLKRRNLRKLYPKRSLILKLVTYNPKKIGSGAHKRFEAYTGSGTVGEYMEKGGTLQDLADDISKSYVSVTVIKDKK